MYTWHLVLSTLLIWPGGAAPLLRDFTLYGRRASSYNNYLSTRTRTHRIRVHASGRELEWYIGHAAQYTMDYSIRTRNGRLSIAEKGCNF